MGVVRSWFYLTKGGECGCGCRTFWFDLRWAVRDYPQADSQSVCLVPLCRVTLISRDLQLYCVDPRPLFSFYVGFGCLSVGCLRFGCLLHTGVCSFILRLPLHNWSWAMSA